MASHRDEIALIATLNDLLQFEHDALPAYDLAIAGLRDSERIEAVKGFRADHRRHLEELLGLIQERGGLPLSLPHVPTGMLKLAVQAFGLPDGDRGTLLAFRANEWQAREKYRRAATGDYPPAVVAILQRAAEDEARHYAWVVEALNDMGLGTDTLVGVSNAAFARLHGTMAEVIEGITRSGLEAFARIIRPVT